MGSISLLLADDSVTIQKVVGIIFGSEDYSLTVVSNGTAAVEKARELHPDVMLVDALMPGMSGYEVCEAIRGDSALAATPILLLAGSFEPLDEEQIRQCGADDYILKPFESQQMVAKVQQLYQLGRGRAAVPAALLRPAAETAPAVEPAPFATTPFEPTPFDTTVFEPPAVPAVSETSTETFSFQTDEPEQSGTPDDPWGLYNQPPAEQAAAPLPSMPVPPPLPELEQLYVAPAADVPPPLPVIEELYAPSFAVEPPPLPDTQLDASIGAPWTPVEEQTFEFVEEPSALAAPAPFEPTVTVAVPPAEEPPFSADADELPPVSADVVPASAAVPQLTEEQLKAAIMAASQETIERIVWEVVPDLAETMIREAIRRITAEN